MRVSVRSVVWFLSAAFVCSTATHFGASVSAQRKTVWSGVFTPEQADRGKKDYELYCASCHGPDMSGGDGPALVGNDFLRNWFEDDMNNLVDKVQARMPGDAPGSLSMKEATDLVSLLLQANGFPAGTTELPPDLSALSEIRIEGKDGPTPVPNFSLVVVVGCLTQGPDSQWIVTHGTEPLRTRDSAPTRHAADAAPPATGTQTFRLMDVASTRPENSRGRRVEVKGLLMRQPTGPALNVTSIQSVSPNCP